MRTAFFAALIALLPTVAFAEEPDISSSNHQAMIPITGPRRGDKEFRGYIAVQPGRFRSSKQAVKRTRLIYLNGCFDGGCTLTPGFEDSITNRSAIINAPAKLSAFQAGEEKWRAVVNCVRDTYAPFDVVITDQDPGNMPHFEAMIAGIPSEADFEDGVAGVAPFDKNKCSVIENSISFSFANVLNGDVEEICWTAAQEIAHTFGLDHEFLCEDPMTYLQTCPKSKRFQNKTVRCGEFEERDCECGKKTQNSLLSIMQVFGPREKTPPTITILEPQLGDDVGPGFRVRARVEEDIAVGAVELWIDGKKYAEVKNPSSEEVSFRAPLEVVNGNLTLEVRAADIFGAKALSQVRVTQAPLCAAANECGAGDTCVHGRCCAGPNVEGGMGRVCAVEADCKGGLCVADGDESLCTEPCILGGGGCPDGFVCEEHGIDSPVCWPSQGSGGCATETPSPLWLSLLLLAVIPLARRRARA